MDELKKQAEELGIKVDGRWSAERLQAEIDEALNAPSPVVVDEPAAEVVAIVEALPEAVEPEVDLTEANAEIQAEIEARAEANDGVDPDLGDDAPPAEEGSMTIINLKENSMLVLGLQGLHSESTLHAAQLAEPRFAAKVQRAIDLGLIMVKNKAE